jgi:hypothetical protein
MPKSTPEEPGAIYDPDDKRKIYRIVHDDEGVKVTQGERTVWTSKTRSRLSAKTSGISAAAIREINAALAKVNPW